MWVPVTAGWPSWLMKTAKLRRNSCSTGRCLPNGSQRRAPDLGQRAIPGSPAKAGPVQPQQVRSGASGQSVTPRGRSPCLWAWALPHTSSQAPAERWGAVLVWFGSWQKSIFLILKLKTVVVSAVPWWLSHGNFQRQIFVLWSLIFLGKSGLSNVPPTPVDALCVLNLVDFVFRLVEVYRKSVAKCRVPTWSGPLPSPVDILLCGVCCRY
jgi:hypothetical protein